MFVIPLIIYSLTTSYLQHSIKRQTRQADVVCTIKIKVFSDLVAEVGESDAQQERVQLAIHLRVL